jgi:hypothetical protein
MPIVFTYDLDTSTVDNDDRMRINLCFKRLGWESIGGSALRYPRFTTTHVTEDWLNHVIPALMYFRSYVSQRDITVTRYSLDVQSSSGYRSGGAGNPIHSGDDRALRMYAPGVSANVGRMLSEQRLRDWLSACEEDLQGEGQTP